MCVYLCVCVCVCAFMYMKIIECNMNMYGKSTMHVEEEKSFEYDFILN